MSDESPTSAEDGNSAGVCPKCGSTDIIQVPPILDETILECQKCQTEFAPDGYVFEAGQTEYSEAAEERLATNTFHNALIELGAIIGESLVR